MCLFFVRLMRAAFTIDIRHNEVAREKAQTNPLTFCHNK